MRFICILLLIAMIFAIPMALLVKNKQLINSKALLMGVILYFVFRIVLYPILSLPMQQMPLLVKAMSDVILLCLYVLIIKQVIFKHMFHYDTKSKAQLFSIGLSESLLEMVFIFLPTLLNLGMYAYLIEFSNIYQTLSSSYTVQQIDGFVATMNAIGYDYYIYMGLIIVAIYVFNVTNNYLLVKQDKRSYVITIALYLIYFVISLLNYWIAVIGLFGLITYIYYINSQLKE